MRRSVAAAVRIASIVLGVLGLHRLCLLPFHCNRVLNKVQVRSSAAMRSSPTTAARIARMNIDQLRHVAAGCQTEVTLHILLAMNHDILGNKREALRSTDDALRVDQRPELYFNRGMALFDLGDIDGAVVELVKAVRFDPNLVGELDGEMRERVTKAAAGR